MNTTAGHSRMIGPFAVLALLSLAPGPACAGWFGGKSKAKPDAFFKRHKEEAAKMQALSVVHAPVRESACLKCHADPKEPGRLATPQKELCLSCHEQRGKDLKKPVVHMPFSEMDCSTCHDPHASEFPALLSAAPKELCAMCHAVGEDPIRKAHLGITSFEGECTACHSPHASANPKLILETRQHMPFKDRACEVCHQEPGPGGAAKLQEPISNACFMCHSDLQELKKKKTVHMPFESGDCALCHFPHVSEQTSLLKAPAQTVCRQCHSEIPDVNHPRLRHPSFKEKKADPRRPGKPFNCASCHNPHASALPKLFEISFGRMCLQCHKK